MNVRFPVTKVSQLTKADSYKFGDGIVELMLPCEAPTALVWDNQQVMYFTLSTQEHQISMILGRCGFCFSGLSELAMYHVSDPQLKTPIRNMVSFMILYIKTSGTRILVKRKLTFDSRRENKRNLTVGNNPAGRGGMLKCKTCRDRRRKVILYPLL